MYITGTTSKRNFGYEIYFTSPKLKNQFKAAKLNFDDAEVYKYQRALNAAYTLTITEMISDEVFKKIREDISKKITNRILENN
jgi:hypothetical protein